MTTPIQALLNILQHTEAELREELAKEYPIGCKVVYRLREGTPEQIGTVLGHPGGLDGMVKIRYQKSRRSASGKPYEQNLPAKKILRRTE